MHAIDIFLQLAAEERFKGWPLVGTAEEGDKIPFFGKTLNYQLATGNGTEDYTSILRHFGWSVAFGVTAGPNPMVPTLIQWKPGVNQASWELPPGGIGKLASDATILEIIRLTKAAYLTETGLGGGTFNHLGRVLIETGKYRGASADDHGLAAHLLLATDLEPVQDARNPNPNEIMETIMVPLTEFPAVLESGFFVETSAVACAYKALLALGHLSY